MNRKNLLSIAAAVIAIVGAGTAFAGDSRSTTSHACSTADHGDRDYGAPCTPAAASMLTRAQVRAETEAAVRAGLLHDGDYDARAERRFMPTLTRAQVKAETLEAIRLGVIGGGDQDMRERPTAAQLESIRMAGQRALKMSGAAS